MPIAPVCCAGIIYGSYDGGKTWEDPTDLPWDAGDAPSNVVVSGGRIWKAVPGSGNDGRAFLSAPEDADLLKASSWTLSAAATFEGIEAEAVTLATRDGTVASASPLRLFTRAPDPDMRDAVALVYAKGKGAATIDPTIGKGYVELIQHGKFSMFYDTVSDKYWALTNTRQAYPRNVLGLFVSDDLEKWTYVKELLRGPSNHYHAFQYPSAIVDKDAIVYVCRTAWEDRNGQPVRWHDGNMLTFHRVDDFRKLA
jgi:hypothetical protein